MTMSKLRADYATGHSIRSVPSILRKSFVRNCLALCGLLGRFFRCFLWLRLPEDAQDYGHHNSCDRQAQDNTQEQRIPFAVIGCMLMIYINIIATIKRLRDLGRSERDYFLLYIPFVSWFMDMTLWFKPGQEEIGKQASREYMIRQYEKKHQPKKRPYQNNGNIPRRHIDFRL